MRNIKVIKEKILFFLATISAGIYILWRIFFTLPIEYGLVALIVGILLVVSEAVGFFEAFSHCKSLSKKKEPKLPIIKKEDYPHVDVFIATHSEDKNIIYKVVNGCVHMDYPDKNKVHIYICDDTNRKEMKELANEFNVGYFGLIDNKTAKAGNINNALSKTRSPLIVTFDADMIPRKKFLMETVPYFFLPKMKEENGQWVYRNKDEIDDNYKIGFIQTPQSFYNADLFQYNLYLEKDIPNEQDYFFREVNVGRNRTNTPIYAGSNTVISREALEEVGGIVEGNITEDFATGIQIQSKGYTCFAIKKALANGLAPIDFKNLIKQRQRWARGCIQTIRSLKFFKSKLNIKSKLSYMTCFLYWWTFFRRFIYILSPILYTVFGLVIVKCTLKELLFIWLPSYMLYNITIRSLSDNIRNQKWSNIIDTIIFPYLIIPVFLETIGFKLKKFNVTSKKKVDNKNTQFKYAIPHIILLIGTLIGLIYCIEDMIIHKSLGSIVLVYWLVLNSYFLLMALTFMLGRVNYRDQERYYAKLDVNLNLDKEVIKGKTVDISEGGMAIELEYPFYIPYKKDIEVVVYNDDYKAQLFGKIVHVDKCNELWRYSIKISNMTEENKREYYCIVYDRQPTLAKEIKSNTIKEVYNNIFNRVKRNKLSNRKLPRICINKYLKDIEGNTFKIENFNYEYLAISQGPIKDHIELDLDDNLILKCELQNIKNKNSIYKIINFEDIRDEVKLKEKINNWIK
ncbi:glycosyltransferase family 2 protein [Clostridium thermobutyricum]|uniref:Cellulose synthase catalytic subunit n=1 Tax=Clostridium thermobutyricum DSM 4928 TaxID=1121339 RepID=A0A1V4SYM0_9CLOT|nr:glycosyltransferase family 2 protein [Clostridium thermobutyricum]OPX50152.1 cellulose synthase catalytic subunit [Clostridium thermobutyricum DSM 4928]